MTSLVLSNNAQSILASGITNVATQLTVDTGQGALFPSPGVGEWFPLSLVSADGSTCEIVRATSRAGDDIEIVRAQEGTAASSLVAGDYVLHQMTAAAHMELATAGNVSLETSAGTSSAYTVAQDSISTLTNGIAFGFIVHATNVGTATLKVGNLPAKGLRKYAYNGSDTLQALGADELLLGKQAIVHYQLSNDVFIVSNPNVPTVPDAAISTKGIAQIADVAESSYNTSGNNAKIVTQQSASLIAEEAVANYDATVANQVLPFIWRDLGTGNGGVLNVLSASTTILAANQTHQFQSVNVDSGGTIDITSTGVCIIRVTGKFTLNGTIEFPLGNISFPTPCVGPNGGVNTTYHTAQYLECNGYPAQQPGDNRPKNDVATALSPSSITRRKVELAILGGYAMHCFSGGNGATYRNNTVSEAKGGLIIIADEIEFGSTAIINAMSPVPSQDLASFPHQGPGAGGMITLVADTITVDASALFEAAVESTPATTDNHRTKAQLATDPHAFPGPPGAANGQLITVNRTTNDVQVVF